ncbi:MAG: zf-HC2 domain-containing protein [Acidimicrobiales bacterium]
MNGTRGHAAPEGGHITEEALAAYAGGVATLGVWSVEAHLASCGPCRAALAAQVDPARLERGRAVVLVRTAMPDGLVRRVLRRLGVPDQLVELVAATPSLRLSWLLSVVGVLAAVSGEAVVAHARFRRPGGVANQSALAPLLLVAPLLVLAAVAAAFLPMFDPSHQVAVASPMSGVKLLLVRTVAAATAAVIPVVAAGFIVPGPGWLPAALLLPSLAICAVALAALTVVGPAPAAVAAGAVWLLPAVVVATTHPPLVLLQWHAQAVCAVVLLVAAGVVLVRRDRLDLGGAR